MVQKHKFFAQLFLHLRSVPKQKTFQSVCSYKDLILQNRSKNMLKWSIIEQEIENCIEIREVTRCERSTPVPANSILRLTRVTELYWQLRGSLFISRLNEDCGQVDTKVRAPVLPVLLLLLFSLKVFVGRGQHLKQILDNLASIFCICMLTSKKYDQSDRWIFE